jgi:hypothetical protein
MSTISSSATEKLCPLLSFDLTPVLVQQVPIQPSLGHQLNAALPQVVLPFGQHLVAPHAIHLRTGHLQLPDLLLQMLHEVQRGWPCSILSTAYPPTAATAAARLLPERLQPLQSIAHYQQCPARLAVRLVQRQAPCACPCSAWKTIARPHPALIFHHPQHRRALIETDLCTDCELIFEP